MPFLELIVVLTTLCLNASSYDHTNQAKWLDDYEECAGFRQSPIELNSKEAESVCNMPDINFVNFNVIHSTPIPVVNNGHTITLSIPKFYDSKRDCTLWKLFDEVSPHIDKGPFGEEKYVTESIHFHWGSADNHGSEHVMDGQRYSLEMHIVHRNSLYKSFEMAVDNPNGLAVLAFLYQAEKKTKDNYAFQNILAAMNHTTKFNSSAELTSFSLAKLLQNINLNNFYSYDGSLTTPPCTETVKWVVFSEVIQISTQQINVFRSMHNAHGNCIVNNYRELQGVNNRKVILRKQQETEN